SRNTKNTDKIKEILENKDFIVFSTFYVNFY
ncbi:unnamed protein product, partial [marine sediment metagenome]